MIGSIPIFSANMKIANGGKKVDVGNIFNAPLLQLAERPRLERVKSRFESEKVYQTVVV